MRKREPRVMTQPIQPDFFAESPPQGPDDGDDDDAEESNQQQRDGKPKSRPQLNA
jgi:hypothetical protein